jgi:hypothetical protein
MTKGTAGANWTGRTRCSAAEPNKH